MNEIEAGIIFCALIAIAISALVGFVKSFRDGLRGTFPPRRPSVEITVSAHTRAREDSP